MVTIVVGICRLIIFGPRPENQLKEHHALIASEALDQLKERHALVVSEVITKEALVDSNTALPVIHADFQRWFSANASYSHCIDSDGPSAKIDSFGADQNPTVTEGKDKYGNLYKVEVEKYNSNGTVTAWIYYRHRDVCEDEQINANKSLADKYR